MRKRIFNEQTSKVAQKSPMEDYLFILVICLSVAVNYFATKTLADRFALAEKSIDPQSISIEDYSQLPVIEMRGDESGVSFREQNYDSVDAFGQFVSQLNSGEFKNGVLLKVERSRSVGDLEDLKHLFRDKTVYTEWEKRQ